MVINEIIEIITGILLAVGGASFIILKFSSYFGDLWAKKNLESIKKEYQKEIEEYKTHLEMLKDTSLRYSGQQFELYTKLWHSLYDLKSIADCLWHEPDNQNLWKFSQQLKKTTDEVEKSYLFIEDEHYPELKGLLEQFNEYEVGKTKVIQFYERGEGESFNSNELNQWISRNGDIKQKYDEYINEIRRDLKKQIRRDSI